MIMNEEISGQPVHVLGIAGSLRQGSYNKSALRAALKLAPAGIEIEVFDLEGIPPFNQDNEQDPPARVVELKAKVRSADAILFVTPEYNYSVPGVLKNAIDWGSRPYNDNAWGGKPAAIMGASTGRFGTARAQYHLRQVLLAVNMHALNRPEIMIGEAASQFDAEGNLTNGKTHELIVKLLNNLAERTLLFRRSGR
jgi:chromate reductase, NAD(P)H dehydrogenase (quinone)